MFLLEDGTGLSASNSYASVAEWKAYWTDRAFDFSAYTDPNIQAALIKATDYIDTNFRNRFIGYILVETQALAWPRALAYIGCVVQTGVPINLKRATYEYAKRALTTILLPDPADTDATGQLIAATEKTVGPITIKNSYASVGALSFHSYPAADKWLTDLMFSGEGVVRN